MAVYQSLRFSLSTKNSWLFSKKTQKNYCFNRIMSSNSPPGNSENHENNDHPNAASPIENLGARLRNLDVDSIRRYLAVKLGLQEEVEAVGPSEKVLDEVNLDGIVRWIQSPRCKRIITLAGAGISTSAGIPDFRSPDTGLYHNLQKYNLPEPQAIFEINFFRQNPKPFFTLAKELFPGNFKPTVSHYFIRLLHEKGYLLRHYTQNIDTLERGAGIPGEKLVEAHGTFYTSHCLECRKEYPLAWIKERIFAEEIPICTDCPGVVKPDIVFFGESLPERFQLTLHQDFHQCDLLIVMGSSLEVQPFASLIDMVPDWCPRLLINREKAGMRSPILRMFGLTSGGLQLDENSVRDVARLGDCDDGCLELADRLGWGDELRNLVAREHARLDMENGLNSAYGSNQSSFVQPSTTKLDELELMSHLPDIPRPINAPPTPNELSTIIQANMDHSTILQSHPSIPSNAIMDHSTILHSHTSLPTNAIMDHSTILQSHTSLPNNAIMDHSTILQSHTSLPNNAIMDHSTILHSHTSLPNNAIMDHSTILHSHTSLPNNAIMDHSTILQSHTSLPTNASGSAISQTISDALVTDTESLAASHDLSHTQVPMDHTSVIAASLPHLPDVADLHRLLADQPSLQKQEPLVSQTNSAEQRKQ